MKKLFLLFALGLLSLFVGCGSSSTSGNGFGSGGTTANSKLMGQYAYQLTGIDLTTQSFFREAGVFTADGNGHITAGIDDTSEGTSVALNNPSTGSYSISSDGTGSAVLNFNNGSALTVAFTVVSASKIDLIEVDSGVTAGGTAELQTPSAFAAPPSGTYAFRLHTFRSTLNTIPAVGEVGAFTVSSGAVTGSADVNNGGVVGSATLTGSFNFPDATSGRGTGTFNDTINGTIPFAYYMIDANTFLLFSTTPGVVGVGRAEMQSTNAFTAASLTGGYAFGSRGDTAANGDGVRTAGRFDADGNGNITGGVYDAVQDGSVASNASFTGTYTMAADGRAAVSLAGGTIQKFYWMVSPARAFFLVDDSAKVEDGTVDLQSGTFSNSSLSGSYAFVNDGYLLTTGDTYDRVGLLTPDGAGNLGLEYILNLTGTASNVPVTLHGTYSVAGNGRATGSVSSLSSNLVFYLVSGSQAYMLQADSGTEIDGSVSKQQ